MKITNYTTNDFSSELQKTNPQSSLLEKIKKIIIEFLSFIQNNTSCMRPSTIDISKQENAPTHLTYDEILKIVEEENNRVEEKRDLTFITFLFKDPIYDILTNKRVLEEPIYEEMNSPLYDTPTNNKRVLEEPIYDIPTSKRVLEEPIYEEMGGAFYDTPTNNKRISEGPIYDIPTSNKLVSEEPIYEEIDESPHWVENNKVSKDIPPPLPPRNP